MNPAPQNGRLLERLRQRSSPELVAAGLLLLATVAALAWANSPAGATYATFWHAEVGLRLGRLELSLSLYHLVNDGLMAFFFFIVGLEVKRELVLGELADRRRAVVPILAATMGLIVPALVYAWINRGGEAASAWGMVISTDTAFLLGVIALLGRGVPIQLRVFLLALAVVDDVGALAVIAVFYTDQLHFGFLALAGFGVALMLALQWIRIWRGPPYLVLAVVSWVMLYLSGVHATLLGVAIALITPAYRIRRQEVAEVDRLTRAYLQHPHPSHAQAARLALDRSVPVGERLQEIWRPWIDYLFVPMFALANAGVVLSAEALSAAAASSVTHGAIAGLVLGKPIGILLGCALAVGLKLGDLPPGLTKLQLTGGAVLTGIGFTISLLIVGRAIPDPAVADQARVGILMASLLAGALGYAMLRLAARRVPRVQAAAGQLQPPVDVGRDHIRGSEHAPLTLVGFGDFRAPFQGWGILADLQERFGNQLRYVYRYLPLPEHQDSYLAAEAAEAAGSQGRFWEMHDRLFQHDGPLTAIDLLDHATALGLDVPRFARELGSGQHRRRVEQDLASARASGVDASHSFFVNGQRHTGAHTAHSLAAALLATSGELPGGSPRAGVQASDPVDLDAWDPLDVLARLPEEMAETPDLAGDHPRLTEAQLARLGRVAQRRQVRRGDIVCRSGDGDRAFYIILSSAVAMVGFDRANERRVIRVHRERRYFGLLDLLRGQRRVYAAIVIQAGDVLRIPIEQLQAMLMVDTELRDLLARTFLLREAVSTEETPDLCIVALPNDPRTPALQEWAARCELTVRLSELADDLDSRQEFARLGLKPEDLPVVLMPDGTVLRAAEVADVERAYCSP